jgi:type II secretory pathway pseudopilin PulG
MSKVMLFLACSVLSVAALPSFASQYAQRVQRQAENAQMAAVESSQTQLDLRNIELLGYVAKLQSKYGKIVDGSLECHHNSTERRESSNQWCAQGQCVTVYTRSHFLQAFTAPFAESAGPWELEIQHCTVDTVTGLSCRVSRSGTSFTAGCVDASGKSRR